jgi:hypothetical protein
MGLGERREERRGERGEGRGERRGDRSGEERDVAYQSPYHQLFLPSSLLPSLLHSFLRAYLAQDVHFLLEHLDLILGFVLADDLDGDLHAALLLHSTVDSGEVASPELLLEGVVSLHFLGGPEGASATDAVLERFDWLQHGGHPLSFSLFSLFFSLVLFFLFLFFPEVDLYP